jgi:hypothetical protein
MFSDSINDQIRDVRRELAAQFGNDLDLILADIRRHEAADGRTYVSFPPRAFSPAANEQFDARQPSPHSVPKSDTASPAP